MDRNRLVDSQVTILDSICRTHPAGCRPGLSRIVRETESITMSGLSTLASSLNESNRLEFYKLHGWGFELMLGAESAMSRDMVLRP